MQMTANAPRLSRLQYLARMAELGANTADLEGSTNHLDPLHVRIVNLANASISYGSPDLGPPSPLTGPVDGL